MTDLQPTPPGADIALSITGVSKRFAGLRALSDVTFEVSRGSIVGIIGPNGAGKSTLFNCISGATSINEGEIVVNSRKVAGLLPHQICRLGLARTFQIARPFQDMTVLENVLVGACAKARGSEATKIAMSALSSLKMEGSAGKDAKDLASVDLRRLEVARAGDPTEHTPARRDAGRSHIIGIRGDVLTRVGAS